MCEFGLDVFGYTPTQTTLAHPSPPHVARLKPFTEQSLHPRQSRTNNDARIPFEPLDALPDNAKK